MCRQICPTKMMNSPCVIIRSIQTQQYYTLAISEVNKPWSLISYMSSFNDLHLIRGRSGFGRRLIILNMSLGSYDLVVGQKYIQQFSPRIEFPKLFFFFFFVEYTISIKHSSMHKAFSPTGDNSIGPALSPGRPKLDKKQKKSIYIP